MSRIYSKGRIIGGKFIPEEEYRASIIVWTRDNENQKVIHCFETYKGNWFKESELKNYFYHHVVPEVQKYYSHLYDLSEERVAVSFIETRYKELVNEFDGQAFEPLVLKDTKFQSAENREIFWIAWSVEKMNEIEFKQFVNLVTSEVFPQINFKPTHLL